MNLDAHSKFSLLALLLTLCLAFCGGKRERHRIAIAATPTDWSDFYQALDSARGKTDAMHDSCKAKMKKHTPVELVHDRDILRAIDY